MDEKVKIRVGCGKKGYVWEGYKGGLTMPVRIAQIPPKIVEEVWDSSLKMIEIETVDEVSKTLEDHIVVDEAQAKLIIKKLQRLVGNKERG